jgi:hypothetical protein
MKHLILIIFLFVRATACYADDYVAAANTLFSQAMDAHSRGDKQEAVKLGSAALDDLDMDTSSKHAQLRININLLLALDYIDLNELDTAKAHVVLAAIANIEVKK